MCRSAGGSFTRWSAKSDIRHCASEVRQYAVFNVWFSDPTSVDRQADWCPSDAADRRTEVLTVQYTTKSGFTLPGKCRRSENNLWTVCVGIVSAAVDVDVAESVDRDTNAVWSTRHATTFTTGHGSIGLPVFYDCRFHHGPGSLFSNWQKSAIEPVCCYTRSCPAW